LIAYYAGQVQGRVTGEECADSLYTKQKKVRWRCSLTDFSGLGMNRSLTTGLMPE
jgi:hypothetical protein